MLIKNTLVLRPTEEYQFFHIPLWVINGVAVFHRAMDRFIEKEYLKDTFPYLDNITVAEHDQNEHDKNVKKFLPLTTLTYLQLWMKTRVSPFAFACPKLICIPQKLLKCLEQIFTFCGMPGFIHSDRGTSFLSQELKEYLSQWGIATSKTTPYHPIGNGQVEHYYGIIWIAVRLSLKLPNLPGSKWEIVFPDALHSIRSLLSTSTNTIPTSIWKKPTISVKQSNTEALEPALTPAEPVAVEIRGSSTIFINLIQLHQPSHQLMRLSHHPSTGGWTLTSWLWIATPY